MLEDSLTDAVNSLAKQLRTFDASIRREDKAIESMKIDLAAARALKSKSARDVDSLAEEVALLRLRKVEEVESKLQETISKRQIANQRSQEAKDDMKREKSDLRAQYDAFLADNEDYLKELDASRLGKTLEDAKKMKAKFLARFPGLEQREEAAISQVDKITERKHKRYKQLQNVEDYISWLTQGKENLNKEQAEVEAQLAARRKEHRESPEESIIAADILTLHHQKQTMQDKVDVLIMKEMQEQQEIAKLRKALDHSVGLLYLGELPRAINGLARRALPLSFSPLLIFLAPLQHKALAAARRDQRSKKGSRAPKSTFVTGKRVLACSGHLVGKNFLPRLHTFIIESASHQSPPSLSNAR